MAIESNDVPLINTELFDVSDCIAVVTGGGTGMGLMMAKTLEANGAKVYILGRRLEVLQEAAKQAVRIVCPLMNERAQIHDERG